MKKKEVLSDYQRRKKRKTLIELADDLDENIQFDEYHIQSVLQEINELAPTKKELKDGLQILIDSYL